MTKRITLTTLIACILFVATSLFSGCSSDDDKHGTGEDLTSRIEALQDQVDQMNSDIRTLIKVYDAVEKEYEVAKVDKTDNGYDVFFIDNTELNVNLGKESGDAPIIGVKEDADGKPYWSVTIGENTDWLTHNGEKVHFSVRQPTFSIDKEGYWAVGYGTASSITRLTNAEGKEIWALDTKGAKSIFSTVAIEGETANFVFKNGSSLSFNTAKSYMLIRKAPEVAPFIYGETLEYDVEAVGIVETEITQPKGWSALYEDHTLTVVAPKQEEGSDKEGEVSIKYLGADGKSNTIVLKVVVEKDYTGLTEGDNFKVNITKITDTGMSATVTPTKPEVQYIISVSGKESYDTKGEADFLKEQLEMLFYYVNYMEQYLPIYLFKGEANYNSHYPLTAGSESYLVLYGVEITDAGYAKEIKAVTPVMTVPFKTSSEIKINTDYRLKATNTSWYGGTYSTNPTDDLPYLHTFVKKEEVDAAESEEAFMDAYVKKVRDRFRRELESGMITWEHLTTRNPISSNSPGEYYYESPLEENTEYYAIAFGCNNGTVTSPLSKALIKTDKFKVIENCTFEVNTEVVRQNVKIDVIPSNKNITYRYAVYEATIYQENHYPGENNFYLMVDDLFFLKKRAESANQPLSAFLDKGDDSIEIIDQLKAATAYIVLVYGCSEDGTITTEPSTHRFVTKGTIDEV